MESGAGSSYDHELEQVLRKHHIGKTLVFVHQPNDPIEKYEKIKVGDVYAEWEITAMEGLINTLQILNDKGKLLSAHPTWPEPDPEAVKALKKKGIDVR